MKLKWDNDKLDMTEFLAFTAREPSLALAFNYASNLINNSYFLEGLVSKSRKNTDSRMRRNARRCQTTTSPSRSA